MYQLKEIPDVKSAFELILDKSLDNKQKSFFKVAENILEKIKTNSSSILCESKGYVVPDNEFKKFGLKEQRFWWIINKDFENELDSLIENQADEKEIKRIEIMFKTKISSNYRAIDFDKRSLSYISNDGKTFKSLFDKNDWIKIKDFMNDISNKLFPFVVDKYSKIINFDIKEIRKDNNFRFRIIEYEKNDMNVDSFHEHIDNCIFTIVFTGDREGLEIYSNNKWLHMTKNKVYVFNSWLASYLSNGKIKPCLHKVTPVATKRISLVFFIDADFEKEVNIGGYTLSIKELKVIKRHIQWKVRAVRGSTLLHISAGLGKYNFLIYVSKKLNINLNIADSSGKTPLHYAIYSRSIETVKTLISHGVNVNCVDKYNVTPLHLSYLFNYEDITLELIKNGAFQNSKNKWNHIPEDWKNLYNQIFKFSLENYW